MSITYRFPSLDSLADHFSTKANAARKAQNLERAYAFEETAHILRHAVLTEILADPTG